MDLFTQHAIEQNTAGHKPKLLAQLDYQEEALDGVEYRAERGIFRQCGVLFTGGGKTSGIAAHVPRRFEHFCRRQRGGHGGLLFIVHRREILFDAYQTFRDAYPHKWIGIEMGELHATGDEDFIFASADSIGTLMTNRIIKMQHRIFGVVITDEAHHLTVDSKWDNILNFFGVGSDPDQHATLPDGTKPLSLLLTATPNRTDGLGLDPFLDPDRDGYYSPTFEYNLAWGIRNGWAVDLRVNHLVDESGVTGKDLATESELDFIARCVRDHCQGYKTLAFMRNVPQSAMLAATLNELQIVSAGHVDGDTDTDVRKMLVDAFRDGDLDLLTNFGVFTEGTNLPGIQKLLLNRPTDSPVLLPQIVGRVTRPHPQANVYTLPTARQRRAAIDASPKPYGHVLCTFSPEDWNLNIVAALTGMDTSITPDGDQTLMEIVDVLEYVEEEAPEVPIREIKTLDDLKVRMREVDVWTQTVYNDDLKALSPLSWVQQGDDLNLYLPTNPFSTKPYEQCPVVVQFRPMSNGQVEKRLIEVGGWNLYLKRPRKASVKTVGTDTNMQQAVNKLDSWLRSKAPALYSDSQRGMHGKADKKALKYLKQNGIKFDSGITQATANLLAADHRIKTAIGNVD
jgi:superfamily II DNA or RNA helicase